MTSVRNPTKHIVVISGLSGSGKSTAIRALEDTGFFCIDNLPVLLVPKLMELAGLAGLGAGQPASYRHHGVDARERVF